ncbi:hypothetical protein V474_19420 [Novosphingobium barchaimii LL02]|uniref:Uncharacterized protein n=1 Tax=Novosphingobium barchaimii LL02 TaxID=1114963 RepID=A0A0J7XUS6_9SPHN|nr:hypothetical protein [Novosphingobium barchaimii]KMS55501.1 hypothetical protein V474_19420 [Novosphingobium barchaimii LL02]
MADTPTSSVARIWASATTNIDNLHQQLGSEPADRRALEERLAASEEHLLGLRAPDITGVIRKLDTLWQQQLHGLDGVSRQKLMVIQDLRRLTIA